MRSGKSPKHSHCASALNRNSAIDRVVIASCLKRCCRCCYRLQVVVLLSLTARFECGRMDLYPEEVRPVRSRFAHPPRLRPLCVYRAGVLRACHVTNETSCLQRHQSLTKLIVFMKQPQNRLFPNRFAVRCRRCDTVSEAAWQSRTEITGN